MVGSLHDDLAASISGAGLTCELFPGPDTKLLYIEPFSAGRPRSALLSLLLWNEQDYDDEVSDVG